MIDRYLLRYFLAVIDQGNFSKAAAQCNVSQPTLSIGIAKLERTLGRALFHRNNRRVELTEGGARFAVHARRIEAEFALAERAVEHSPTARTIRIGVLETMPIRWIEAFVERVQGIPEERIELIEARERDLLKGLSAGRIDAALAIIRHDQDRFDNEPLFTEGYALAMSEKHPLASRATIAGEELAGDPMIVRRHCELLSETSRYFTARGVRPFFPARTFSDEKALAYIRAGLGITVMPDCFVGRGIARPRLADFPFRRDIGILYAPHVDRVTLRKGYALSALVAVIEEMVR